MKKLNFVIVFVLAAFFANARIITVDNNPKAASNYTSLQTALTNCLVDDTIYVMPSVTSYGAITIEKRITLVGGGYNATAGSTMKSAVTTIDIDSTSYPISGIKIIGFYTNGICNTNYDIINKVYIDRVNTYSSSITIRGNSWIIKGCMIGGGINVLNFSSIIISNNILTGAINNTDKTDVIFSNNIFSGGASGYSDVKNATFANNIFYYVVPFATTGCLYVKNLSNNLSTFPPALNTGSGNLNSTDPLFVNVPANNFYYYDFPWNLNFHLKTGSTAISAGSDGTDLGIFGGSSPLPDLTGYPNIPQIQSLLINNIFVPADGDLNVTFKAKKHN